MQHFFARELNSIGARALLFPEKRNDHANQNGENRTAYQGKERAQKPAGKCEQRAYAHARGAFFNELHTIKPRIPLLRLELLCLLNRPRLPLEARHALTPNVKPRVFSARNFTLILR